MIKADKDYDVVTWSTILTLPEQLGKKLLTRLANYMSDAN